ncbi:MAG: HEPN domain-containing protein [Candidatus Pacearchaeota archaeon]|nr:HEPN domain-containing protein [Candidatus Pacearchaeota archaeon]
MNFLSKLKKEGKFLLVEPNEEVKKAYLEKSESNLISAKILLENDRLEEAVSLVYYSMYHLLLALLFKVGVKSENHSISIILLKEIFGIENEEISNAKIERIDKQYYVNFHILKNQVEETIKTAEKFNEKIIDFISKMNNSDILKYREKFKKFFNEIE